MYKISQDYIQQAAIVRAIQQYGHKTVKKLFNLAIKKSGNNIYPCVNMGDCIIKAELRDGHCLMFWYNTIPNHSTRGVHIKYKN